VQIRLKSADHYSTVKRDVSQVHIRPKDVQKIRDHTDNHLAKKNAITINMLYLNNWLPTKTINLILILSAREFRLIADTYTYAVIL